MAATTSIHLQRLDQGREVFAKAVELLLTRNGFTHQEMEELARWAYPGAGNKLSASTLSNLRIGRTVSIGTAAMDCLAETNLALAWLAQDDLPELERMKGLGQPPARLQPKLLNPFCLRSPIDNCPLDAGGLFLVWVGRLIPVGVRGPDVTEEMAIEVSREVSKWARRWITENDVPFTFARKKLTGMYPASEAARAKLWRVITEAEYWTAAELSPEAVSDIHTFIKALIAEGGPLDDSRWLNKLYDL